MTRRLDRWRVMTWLVLGRPARALATLDRMLARDPVDAYALASRAHLRAAAGQRAAAIADAQALVAARPARSAADWFNLAFLLDQDDRLAEAEAAFGRALALDERLDRAWYGLGLVLIKQRRLDEAAVALERNTRLQPMSPYGWYQLARVQFERGRPAEARTLIAHLAGFEPKVARQLERETGLKAAAPCH